MPLISCGNDNSNASVDLAGHSWVLTDLNGESLLENHQPSLEFEAGQVSGNTGCNHYGGSYQIDGDSIQFTDLFNTEMACLDPEGLMQQEQIYLELLRAADRFEAAGGTLTLFTATGQKLIYTNQPEIITLASPTLEPETPTPEAAAPTLMPTFDPPAGFKEYQDPVGGVSIHIPESWVVTGVVEGEFAIFQSYPEDKYIGGEAREPGDTKCDLSIRPDGENAADLIAQWRSDAMTTIVSEEEIRSKTGLVGQRFVIDSMGRATVFLFDINQRVVLLTCFGDFTRVDEIAATFQALE